MTFDLFFFYYFIYLKQTFCVWNFFFFLSSTILNLLPKSFSNYVFVFGTLFTVQHSCSIDLCPTPLPLFPLSFFLYPELLLMSPERQKKWITFWMIKRTILGNKFWRFGTNWKNSLLKKRELCDNKEKLWHEKTLNDIYQSITMLAKTLYRTEFMTSFLGFQCFVSEEAMIRSRNCFLLW